MKALLLAVFAVVACLAPGAAVAQGAHMRLHDSGAGLDASEVTSLTQDPTGFIWLGTLRGVWRYDGRAFEQWGRTALDEVVVELVTSPEGELLARTGDGRVFRRTGGSFAALSGPKGRIGEPFAAISFDDSGSLHSVVDGSLWRRAATGAWEQVELGQPIGELRHLEWTSRGFIAIATDAAWLISERGTAELLLRAPDLRYAAADQAGIWLGSRMQGKLWRVDAQGAHALGSMGGRMLGLAVRKEHLWISVDRFL